MNTITIVDGSFCATRNGEVLGIIRRCGVDQWGFYHLVDGIGGIQYVPLEYALKAAMDFDPFPVDTSQNRSGGFIRGVEATVRPTGC